MLKNFKVLSLVLLCVCGVVTSHSCDDVSSIRMQILSQISNHLGNSNASHDVPVMFSRTDVSDVIENVSELVGCHGHCECLNTTMFFPDINQQYLSGSEDFERLSLAILRYAFQPEATCDDVTSAVSLPFLRGWFSSRDVVEVVRPAIGRVVRESHEHEGEEGHEGHEGHGEEEGHHHERKRREVHMTDSTFFEFDAESGCLEVQCFDVGVANDIAKELTSRFNATHEETMTTTATLFLQAVLTSSRLQLDCGDDEVVHLEDLPTEGDFVADIFHRAHHADDHDHDHSAITFERFEILRMLLGLTSSSSHESDEHSSHEHKRKRRATHSTGDAVSECYPTEDLYRIYSLPQNLPLTPAEFSLVCPSLIQQILSGQCAEEDHHDDEDDKPTNAEKYGYSSVSVLIICLTAFPGMVFIHFSGDKRSLRYRAIMSIMIGLAIGTLFADAMLHLIPAALGLHVHGHGGESSHEEGEDSHDHHDHSGPEFEDHTKKLLTLAATGIGFFIFESCLNLFLRGRDANKEELTLSHAKQLRETDEESVESNGNFCTRVKSVAWMIILGDSLHNFVDGLAIAAAFSNSVAGGISTSIAIICHEIPHELGDFAVLVNSGMTVCEAAIWNFVSALTCFAGLYVGLPLAVSDSFQNWIFVVAAGLFIYIALAEMVPECRALQEGKHGFVAMILQVIGIIIGTGILLVIALYEEKLHTLL